MSEGAGATLQLLEQRNRVEGLRGELQEAKVDRRRQRVVIDQAIQRLRTEISKLEGQLTQENVKLRYQKVTSPVDGVVFDLEPSGPGYVNRDSKPVLKVVPRDCSREW